MTETIMINDITPRIQYTASGFTTKFYFSFPIFAISDLVVWLDEKRQTTGYTITISEEGNGYITFAIAPNAGTMVTLVRTMAYEQHVDFTAAGNLRRSVIHRELSRIFAMIQQLGYDAERAVSVSVVSNSNPSELVEKIEILYADKDNINTVAGSIGAVNVAADNIAAILSAPAQAAASATSATASATSATASATSALDAANSAASALLSAESASQSETNAATSASQAAVSAAAAVGLPLGFSFFSDHLINNISYLRADTFSWQSGVTYKSMYDELVAQYNGVAEASTETLGGVTVTFKRAANGWKIVDGSQEQAVLNMYNAIGVAWYYVLDVANGRFKLPRKNPKYDAPLASAPVIGNGKSLYLTNGSYNKNLISYQGGSTQYLSSSAGGPGTGDNHIVPAGYPNVVASSFGTSVTLGLATSGDSGVIIDVPNMAYDEDANGARYLYFFVGNFTQTAVENTAGLNAELFNGKLDRNVSNLSAEGKSSVSGLSAPSDRYDTVPIGASESIYDAPADGYFAYHCGTTSASAAQVILERKTDGMALENMSTTGLCTVALFNINLNLRVRKNDKLWLYYSGPLTGASLRFYYSEGAN